MKVKSESEGYAQSYLTLIDPMDCSPPGSSIHGIFQARVLEWGAVAFSVFHATQAHTLLYFVTLGLFLNVSLFFIFIWLCRVLVVVHGILTVACGSLVLWHVGICSCGVQAQWLQHPGLAAPQHVGS